MGIRGLLSYLIKNNIPERLQNLDTEGASEHTCIKLPFSEAKDIEALASALNPLIMDGPSLVHECLRSIPGEWWHGGELQKLAVATRDWVSRYSAMGFHLVIIFDVGYEPVKVPEKVDRDAEKLSTLAGAFESTTCPPSGPISPLSWGVVLQALNGTEAEVLLAKGEADSAIIQESAKRGGTVLTNDTDLLVLAAQQEAVPRIIFQNCTIDNALVLYDLEEEIRGGSLTLWNAAALVRDMELTKEQAALLAAIVGNDITKPMRGLMDDMVNRKSLPGREKGHHIQKVQHFVKRFRGVDDCEDTIRARLGERWDSEASRLFRIGVSFYCEQKLAVLCRPIGEAAVEDHTIQLLGTGRADRNLLSGALFGEAVLPLAAEDPEKISVWEAPSLRVMRRIAYGLLATEGMEQVVEHVRRCGEVRAVAAPLTLECTPEQRRERLEMRPWQKLRSLMHWALVKDTESHRDACNQLLLDKGLPRTPETVSIALTAIALRATQLVVVKGKREKKEKPDRVRVVQAMATMVAPGSVAEEWPPVDLASTAERIHAREAVAHWVSQCHAFLSVLWTLAVALRLEIAGLDVPDGSAIFRAYCLGKFEAAAASPDHRCRLIGGFLGTLA